MDFIFMLTRSDQTVPDGLEVLEHIRPVGLEHIGFKDIGVDVETMRALNREIKDAGATSYIELVSLDADACRESARAAKDIGIDRLMGGTDVEGILAALKGSDVSYLPFPGRPYGHPVLWEATAEGVEAQCRRFIEMGCGGCDALAYRAADAEPMELIRAARKGLGDGYLVNAGSVNNRDQIAEMKTAGCDAFTIGSAAFDGSFSPLKGSLRSQLTDILEACR